MNDYPTISLDVLVCAESACHECEKVLYAGEVVALRYPNGKKFSFCTCLDCAMAEMNLRATIVRATIAERSRAESNGRPAA